MQQSTNGWNANYSTSEKTSFFNNTNHWQPAPNVNSSDEDDGVHSRTSMELMHTCQVYSTSKFAASLLSRAISAFPQMMLRRQTFPPFIHAHWHLPSLPETLANCMSIAQLFATRTAETRPFLWRTIGTEVKRLQDEVHSHSVFLKLLEIKLIFQRWKLPRYLIFKMLCNPLYSLSLWQLLTKIPVLYLGRRISFRHSKYELI